MWVILPSVGEGMVVLWDMVPFPYTPRKLDQSSITDVWEHTHMISPTRAISSILLPLKGSEGTGKLLGFGDSSGPVGPSSWVLWPMLND